MYSNEKSVCLDIFAGSGTLGRACINLNRDWLDAKSPEVKAIKKQMNKKPEVNVHIFRL